MSITPINPITSLDQISEIGKIGSGISPAADKDGVYSFGSVFQDAINNVASTNETLKEEAYKLATGQTDNLHDITIASTKAGLAVDLFVQIRNKTLSAYQELMNLNI